MIITKAFVKRLVNALNESSEVHTCGTATLREEYDEHIITYEDLNGYTHSIYFSNSGNDCTIGYLDYEGIYHWYATRRNLQDLNESVFLIDIGICLHTMERYIEEHE